MTVQKDPDANIDWTAIKTERPDLFVQVYRRELIDTVKDVRSALQAIGAEWMGGDHGDHYGDDAEFFTGSFEFEADGHRFTVTVKPL